MVKPPRDSRRRNEWTSLGAFRPPPGAPPALHRRARLARVREALGPELGRCLKTFTGPREGVVWLQLHGTWRAALRDRRDELAERLSKALGRQVRDVEIVELAPLTARKPQGSAARARGEQTPSPRERLERLRDALARRTRREATGPNDSDS